MPSALPILATLEAVEPVSAPTTPTFAIPIPRERLAEFCRRWDVVEFALFGSVLRPDFRPDSDVDVMVTFAPEARRTLYDLVQMQDELVELFGRKVDLLVRDGVERSPNRRRRNEILNTAVAVNVT